MRKYIDKYQYKLFERLWYYWHSKMPRMYGGWQGYVPHPWWHLCCNGDSGGWRTHLCDWFEEKFRFTNYYSDRGEW